MKYSYNLYFHLLIVIGSLIALEILAAKHVNNGFPMTGPPAAILVKSSMSEVRRTESEAASFSSVGAGVKANDAQEETWENTKFIISIIL